MKTNLLKTLLVGAALMLGLGASAQTERFYVGVTGYDNNHENSQTVYATMYDNFAFSINLPDASAKIGAKYADINMCMTGVEGLGLAANETRKYRVSYDTGVPVTEQTLSEWLPNSYALADSKVVSVPVTVVDYIKTNITPTRQTFTYTIAGVEKTQIVGTPSSTEDAAKAWAIITNETKPTRPESHDSKFILKDGAYFQIGNEKVFCDGKDVELLVNNGQETVQNTLTSELSYTTVTEDTKKVVLYLPAGSTMKVDNSMAELENNCTITFDCSNLEDGDLNNLISTARNLNGATTEDAMKKISIQNVLKFFDALIGLIDKATVIPCTVQFGQPTNVPFITVYAGKETPEDGLKTIAEFERTRASYPNAIGFVTEDHAIDVVGKENIVVEYGVGKSGKYYECEKFVLTDRKSGTNCSFYSPVRFNALTGGYTRSIKPVKQDDPYNNASCCLPFALSTSELGNVGKILTFSYAEPVLDDDNQQTGNYWIYFNSRNQINAGIPCFLLFPGGEHAVNITFSNTEIVGEPDNSANLQGTFTYTNAWSSSDYYGVAAGGTTLSPYTSTTQGTPLRSSLFLGYTDEFNGGENKGNSAAGAKNLFIAIIENGEATSVDGVKVPMKPMAETIYSINGTKISKISKPGLYIVNGVKRFVK